MKNLFSAFLRKRLDQSKAAPEPADAHLQALASISGDFVQSRQFLMEMTPHMSEWGYPADILMYFEGSAKGCLAYGQYGEDVLLWHIFADRPTGFYVDIGAHHPVRFSNTWRLYRKGWRGINIDATPGSMAEFMRLRPEDINLELGVGNPQASQNFYIFPEPALNTYNESLARAYEQAGWGTPLIKSIPQQSVEAILDAHLPEGGKIDFMSLDIEGHELEALESNNWNKYVPEYICMEILGKSLVDIPHDVKATFLLEKGYVALYKIWDSVIFQASAPL